MNREQIENLIQVLEEELDRVVEEEGSDTYGYVELGDKLCVEYVRDFGEDAKIFIGEDDDGYWLTREQAIQAVDFIQDKLGV